MNKRYRPKELAALCGSNINTLNGYLRHKDIFPPVDIDEENGYRTYDDNTANRILLYKRLKKRPFNITMDRFGDIIDNIETSMVSQLLAKTNTEILSFLMANDLWK